MLLYVHTVASFMLPHGFLRAKHCHSTRLALSPICPEFVSARNGRSPATEFAAGRSAVAGLRGAWCSRAACWTGAAACRGVGVSGVGVSGVGVSGVGVSGVGALGCRVSRHSAAAPPVTRQSIRDSQLPALGCRNCRSSRLPQLSNVTALHCRSSRPLQLWL